GFAENTDDLFVGKTLLHGDVLMWLMKTLLTSGCTNQRGAGQCSFRLALNDRILLSNINSEVSVRKIAKDEHLWTRKSLVEVIKEMSSKN
ncbi:hypothetical protein, partial [Klebsiella pneumoniae]|uniref:hypothetical protein n=1 Tax=Klebsiella pneumoniae TaxID=573 RepID=UPI003C7097CC